ncbi:hypothetical protein [Corallibacter sp.]|uniref:hypothetical protein n=1 Tax=Corallibacter sp. TaxID=2038084 RepID=UPI003A8E56CF
MTNSIIAFFIALLFYILIIATFLLLDKIFKLNINDKFFLVKRYQQLPLLILIFFGCTLLIYGVISNSESLPIIIKEISPSNGMGQFGDFFNGILTPFLTIITIVFLYRAFKEQFKANELFYSFELEKSFKEDIDWLRSNSEKIIELENKISSFEGDKQLENYLYSENTILIRESIYFISMFIKIYNKLDSRIKDVKFDNNEILNNIKQDVVDIFIIYYLDSFKQVFRDLNNYLNNKSSISKDEFNGLNIKFMEEFSVLYPLIKSFDGQSNMFNQQILQFKKKLKELNNER